MPGGWEWLIIVGVLVLLFGAKRLPDMARSVGQSARVFKGEMKGLRDDEGRNGARTPPAGARSAAPVEPAALPPAGDQVDDPAGGPVGGTTTGPVGGPVDRSAPGVGGQPSGGSVRRDADR
jgi:sec-independent protein translocase protein TatA